MGKREWQVYKAADCLGKGTSLQDGSLLSEQVPGSRIRVPYNLQRVRGLEGMVVVMLPLSQENCHKHLCENSPPTQKRPIYSL
jgi:hypothetical protein